MTQYKLLALDMDGTLLDSRKRVPPPILAALARLVRDGICVTLATGRGLAELGDYRELIDVIPYGILISGGLVYDFRAESRLYAAPLDLENSLAVLAQGDRENAMTHILTFTESVVRERDLENLADFAMRVYYDMYRRNCRCENNLVQFIREHANEIAKINLYHRSPESRDRSLAALSERKLSCVQAESTSLEMNTSGITKATGLQKLCAHLNIPLSATVAVGDAANDREILRAAGLAVAMGNAAADIKALADMTVADNDHGGVGEVIEKIFSR